MSDAMVPSYRVARDTGTVSWRMLAVAGALLGGVALLGAGWWVAGQMGPRSVPVIEADGKPFKIRPDDPGGLRVPNQSELVLERPENRGQPLSAGRSAAVLPPAETPNLEQLRAMVAPPIVPAAPAPRSAAPAPAAPEPAPARPAAAAPPEPARPPQTAPAAAPAVPPVVASGRVQVQLGALNSAEAARSEWDRLARRMPEFFQGRSPQVLRVEREGRDPLFRLRTGGFADGDAGREFCEQVKTRANGACMVVP